MCKFMDKLFEDSPKWLQDSTILVTCTGSVAYGTNIEGVSDTDFRGVCIPPLEYYLGLDSFNEYNKTGGKDFKNTSEDTDIAITHINKFVKSAMSGIPNNLEILFTKKEHIMNINEYGRELIDRRHDFLSKNLYRKFSGYAKGQKHQLLKTALNKKGRTDLIEEFGYDTKVAMHSIRLLTSAIEIFKTGNMHTYHPERELLLGIRKGEHELRDILIMMDSYSKELDKLYETSNKVPNLPDYNKINKWLTELNNRALFK